MPQLPPTYESTMQVSIGGVGGDADNLTEEEIADDQEQQFNNNSGDDDIIVTSSNMKK